MTSESGWVRLIEQTLASFGTLSVLVNNAGIGTKRSAAMTSSKAGNG
jgi:NAD(P)-dependent dehydrogenase (short-subunit alcohol dehydrogenase family)